MTPAPAIHSENSPRTSREIHSQLTDLAKALAAAEEYGERDFAGKMSLHSLRAHERELLAELRAAEALESGREDP